MISIDEHPPPDPSSSDYQNQQQRDSHEALATVPDIDLLKLKDATLDDTHNTHTNFTIRNYVYRSRYKYLTRNWPFSRESLQICLNYSLENILPPFESLVSLRSISPKEETVANVNRKSTDDRFISPTSSMKSQYHLEEDLDHAKSNSQPIVKKRKFIMKSTSGVEPVEDTVAFKVCPVCRTFSSSSNTTLNAHIDQCLSEESSMKSTANPETKTVKHKIKPRKTRLMVDVYKTAQPFTVEELDRRNGTSWATNSNFPDQELEFQAEEKKEQPQEPTFVPKVADNEGAVYIDTNGTKVRILSIPGSSKFDYDNARKLQKGEKGSKFVRGKEKIKACGEKNHRKILKLSPSSKKFSKKATNVLKENVAVKEKKDGGKNPMKAQAIKQMDSLTIRRPPWACSKRTAVAKKRVPVLTKPKEGTRVCESGEDPLISRSKGCKFSSFKKSLLVSASREHNDGSKLNLKRNLSALKKPQESWKQNSRMEEDTGEKLFFEIVNVAKVKKKKSITSKSSNGNRDSSSGGLEISSESARIEVPFHSDHVGIEGNIMGLRNSLDAEFSKMVDQPVNKSDSRKRSLDGILIMAHNTEYEERYFEEVDPIPIPGPPGSFLPPSPGADMVSEEELQGNSSLTTTSRVHSSEDQRHHDLMKTDFISDSPVSTVSSPSFARSDKSSLRFTSHQNKKSINSSDLTPVEHASFTQKGPTPCCCSGKEGVSSQSVPSYHQESSLEFYHSINFLPNLFPSTLSQPETVKSRVDASVKLPVNRDYESVAIPTTPVLRLMGKNLTVVKTDDDASFKPLCSSPMGQYPQFHNIQNDNNKSFYGHPPHHHVIFNQNYNGPMHQLFNPHTSNNSRNLANSSSANVDTNATKEIIVDGSSENECHDPHMFKQSLIRNHGSSSSSLSFANPYGNGSFQTSSNLQEVVKDGNFGRCVSNETRYPLSSIASSFSCPTTKREAFIVQLQKEKLKF